MDERVNSAPPQSVSRVNTQVLREITKNALSQLAPTRAGPTCGLPPPNLDGNNDIESAQKSTPNGPTCELPPSEIPMDTNESLAKSPVQNSEKVSGPPLTPTFKKPLVAPSISEREGPVS